jgi:hypothetical protein
MGGIILQPPMPPAVTTPRMQSTVWADTVWHQVAGYNPPASILKSRLNFRLSIENPDSVETPYLGVHETGNRPTCVIDSIHQKPAPNN